MIEPPPDDLMEQLLHNIYSLEELRVHMGFSANTSWEEFRKHYDNDGEIDWDRVHENMEGCYSIEQAVRKLVSPEELLDKVLRVIESCKEAGDMEELKKAEELRDKLLAAGNITKN